MRLFSSVPPLLVQPRHLPTFLQRQAQLLCLLSLFFWGGLSTVRAQRFQPNLILHEVRYPHDDLIQVCAHRGLYSAYTYPENSLPAIKAAADANIELIELDIKVTKDGVPILMHDPGLKRTVYFRGFGGGNRTAASALVGESYWDNTQDPKHSLSRARLRSNIPRFSYAPHPGTRTIFRVPSLEEALVYIRNNKLHAVFVLDLKEIGALRKCVSVVGRYIDADGTPFLNSFIFKIDGVALASYEAYESAADLAGYDFNYILRFNTTDVVNPKPSLRPINIFYNHVNKSIPGFLGIESVSKTPPPNLALTDVIFASSNPYFGRYANWNYYPLPELTNKHYFWFGAGSPQRDGTYKLGDIINIDNNVFKDTRPDIHEDSDHREDTTPNDFSALTFLLYTGRATGLTYDNPVRLSAKLKELGKRNVSRYYVYPPIIIEPDIMADGAYTVANGASDQLLALNEAGSQAGPGMLAGRPTPARPHQWQVTTTGAGAWFTLANRQTGQRLALAGTQLVLAAANDQDSTQLWTAATTAAEGYVTLRSAVSALTLATDAAGAPVVLPLDSAAAPLRAQLWRLTAVGAAAGASAASPVAASPKPAAGTDLRLEVFPNPATSSFTVRCQGVQSQAAHLALRTLTGQLVAEQEASLQAGTTELRWDTSSLPAGAYVLFLTTGSRHLAKRVLIIR